MNQNTITIKSYKDAEIVANHICKNRLGENGHSFRFNGITITNIDGFWMNVSGAEYTALKNHEYRWSADTPHRFSPSELAEFILYPERKRINDAIRSGLI